MKTVVYTSDSFAASFPQQDKPTLVAQATYNEDAVKAAHDPSSAERIRQQAWDPANAYELSVYAASKVAAEKAVWRLVETEKPSFQVSSVVPNMNFGPAVGDLPLSSTALCIPNLLKGKPSDLFFPGMWFVNVRDCARLHVAALLDSEMDGQRVFAFAETFSWNDVLAILRELRPEAGVMDDWPGLMGRDESSVPSEEAEQLLRRWYGHGWTGLEESVRQNIEGL